ncbi:MAG: DUF1501 domain-containing protein [Lewinellaceae bacterium]|nr:DUF1501 domain-containing protein [Lewinellaceae bacterium]
MCNHDKKPTPRHGSAIEHGQAHELDHHSWSRRMFIRNLGIAGSVSLMLGRMPITAIASSPLAIALSNSDNERILVLVRLKGGNDGLNTIIPVFDYGAYQANRPGIGIPLADITNLNTEFGIPNWMGDILPLWQDGKMKVANSVGYPNHSLSHFRSSDIWASASDADVVEDSGWLGRFLEGQFPDYLTNPPSIPPAIQIGGSGNLIFTNTDEVNMGVIVDDPNALYEIAQNGELYDTANLPDCYYGDQVGYLRTVANSTFRYAESISQAYNASANAVAYDNGFAQQLALVARLIKGGLGTRLYMVTLDGFDTHAGQNNIQPNLLNTLAKAMKAFYDDLAVGGFDKGVLSMTYSEFGRRIEQNASGGTDHGAAAPLLLFGEGLNGNGFVGDNPDLHNLDPNGNLQFSTDFRQVYATLLEYWLCVDADIVDGVLGQSFTRLPELGLDCAPTPVFAPPAMQLKHWASYEGGQVGVNYVLPEGMPVQVEIYNMLGQPVANLFNGYEPAGQHRHVFHAGHARVAAGYYVYSIRAGRQVFSQKLRVAK